MNEEASEPANGRDIIQSIEKGLGIVHCFSAQRPTLTLVEVSRLTGQSRASVRRMLLTLQALGYVAADGRRYRLTPRVLDLGYANVSSAGLGALVTPHLQRLNKDVRETASAGVLLDGEVIYVARAQTSRFMAAVSGVGARLPALATAMGRVLLADLDDESLHRYVQRHPLTPLTPSTRVEPDALVEEVRQVRAQGYAIADEELEIGFRAAAVPVRGHDGKAVVAINVGMHAARVSHKEAVAEVIPLLKETAAEVERELALHPMPF